MFYITESKAVASSANMSVEIVEKNNKERKDKAWRGAAGLSEWKPPKEE